MDMTTGAKRARLIPMDQRVGVQSESSRAMDAAALAANGDGTSVRPHRSAAVHHGHGLTDDEPAEAAIETARRVLLELPEPDPDLADAIRRKVPQAELDALLAKVWEKRQQMLKHAMENMRDDASEMRELLASLHAFGNSCGSGAASSDVVDDTGAGVHADAGAVRAQLEDLEFFVSQIDNAVDFVAMDGLVVMAQLLRSGHAEAVTGACWVVGTAVKYQLPLQEAAVRLGLLPLVVDALHGAIDPTRAGVVMSAVDASGRARLASRALYALAAIQRSSRLAQEQLAALVHSDGAHAGLVGKLLALQTPAAAEASGLNAAARGKVSVKALALLGDVATDPWNRVQDSDATARDAASHGRRASVPPTVKLDVDPTAALGSVDAASAREMGIDTPSEAAVGATGGVKITALAREGAKPVAASDVSGNGEGDGGASSGAGGSSHDDVDVAVEVVELLQSDTVCRGAAGVLDAVVDSLAGPGAPAFDGAAAPAEAPTGADVDLAERVVGSVSDLGGHCTRVFREPQARGKLDVLLGQWLAVSGGDGPGVGAGRVDPDLLHKLAGFLESLPPPAGVMPM